MRYVVLTTQAPRRLLPLGLGADRLQGDQHPGGARPARARSSTRSAPRGCEIGFYHSLIDWHHPEFPVDGIHPQRDDEAFTARAKQGRDIARVRRLPARAGPRAADRLRQDRHHVVRLLLPGPTGAGAGKGKDDWGSERAARDDPRAAAGHPDQRPARDRRATSSRRSSTSRAARWRGDGEPVLWEACQTLNGSWGYDRDNLDWKSPELLVQMLVDTVSKGGNLLLNVGPTGARRVRPAGARATLRGDRRVDAPARAARSAAARPSELTPAARLPLHPARRPPLPAPLRLAVPPRPPRRPRRPRRVRAPPQRRLRDQDDASIDPAGRARTRRWRACRRGPSRSNCRSSGRPTSSCR